MGQYIMFGICHEIIIPQESIAIINKECKSIEEYLVIFEKETNLQIDLYDISEFNGDYKLSLKNDVATSDNYIEFLKGFFSTLKDEDTEDDDSLIEKLKTLKSQEEILALAQRKSYYSFQLSYAVDSVYGMNFGRSITVRYNYIAFFIQGKAILETYGRLFQYIENTMRKNPNDKLAFATKVFLG